MPAHVLWQICPSKLSKQGFICTVDIAYHYLNVEAYAVIPYEINVHNAFDVSPSAPDYSRKSRAATFGVPAKSTRCFCYVGGGLFEVLLINDEALLGWDVIESLMVLSKWEHSIWYSIMFR